VDEFNEHHQDLIQVSRWKVDDESMSARFPHKSKTGGLPNISYIIQKPEPLGMFFLFSFPSYFKPYSYYFLFFLFLQGTAFQDWLHPCS
jgi:hypothetical protein